MEPTGLAGMNVSFVASDPWEFGEEHGNGPFAGKILRVGTDYWAKQYNSVEKEALLLQLAIPLTFEGVMYEYFIVTSRHETEQVGSLSDGAEVHCALTRISKEQATSLDPFDLHGWRGRTGLLATVKKLQ
ncbi:MAG TPA: hypothetical protein VF914_05735 [Chloroflexia bacterium]|jgi:hypothetical protein